MVTKNYKNIEISKNLAGLPKTTFIKVLQNYFTVSMIASTVFDATN